MKCIVSGGTGFIGRPLVDLLLAQGHYVGVYSRQPGKAARNAVATYLWDPLAGAPPEDSVHDMDAVLHLAGETVAQRWDPATKERIRASRVDGTRNLVDVISRVRHKPRVLVCASAIGIYGDRGDEMLNEGSAPGRGFLAETCRAWEAEADRAAWFGVRVVKIRIGFVLGKGGGALAKMEPIFKLGVGGRLGSGKQWMPWVHVQDVARLFLFAAENEVSGVLNGVAPNPVRNSEFTSALASAVHRPALFPVPGFALQIVAGELGKHMLDSARVIPEATQQAGFRFDYSDVQSALADATAG
jgi:uncharacterized protein (TIGR01777 family)